jgi:hypothetical protein
VLISNPSCSAVSGLVGEPETVPKWRAPNYRSLPLGRIVGVPSLWHERGMGVTRQLDINADFNGATSGNIVARQLAGQASDREC